MNKFMHVNRTNYRGHWTESTGLPIFELGLDTTKDASEKIVLTAGDHQSDVE